MYTFTIPSSPVGFSFLDFANHVLDHSPAYETRAKMRGGYKAVDAIDAALKAGEQTFSLENDLAKEFQSAVEQTPIPRMFVLVDGKPGDAVPARFFTPFYEAVESGTNT